MDESKNKVYKNVIPKYLTLGLADPEYIDPRTNATSPSEASVEQTKEWSEENKL